MNKTIAITLLLIACLIIAALVGTKTITGIQAGLCFAVILVLLGIPSKGFSRQ